MNAKFIGIGTVAGGVLLLVVSFLADAIAQLVTPYDIFSIGDMRAINDPMMGLFFLYPFIFALMAAIVFDLVQSALPGDWTKKGLLYGGILFILVVIPNMVVIFSSMTYPAGFYTSNILAGIIGYPLIGLIFAKTY